MKIEDSVQNEVALSVEKTYIYRFTNPGGGKSAKKREVR